MLDPSGNGKGLINDHYSYKSSNTRRDKKGRCKILHIGNSPGCGTVK